MDIQMLFPAEFWAIASVLCTFVVSVSGAINRKFGLIDGWARVCSWSVAVLASAGAWYFGYVDLGEPKWASAIGYAAVIGLASNGLYSLDFIKDFINKWFTKK